MGQDLADIVTAGVQDGEDCVADGAFQRASGQAAIGLHVADLSFDRASPAEVDDLFGSQSSACAADQNTGFAFVMPPVTAINDGEIGALICEDLDLAERFPQRVAVIRIARKAAHADDKPSSSVVATLTLQPNS